MASAILGLTTMATSKADPFVAGMTAKRTSQHPVVRIYNFAKSAYDGGLTGGITHSDKIVAFFDDVLINSNRSRVPKVIWAKCVEFREYARIHRYLPSVNCFEFQEIMRYLHAITIQIDMLIASTTTYSEKADGSGRCDMSAFAKKTDIGEYIARGLSSDDKFETDDIREQYRLGEFLQDYDRVLKRDTSILDSQTPLGQTGYDYSVSHGLIRPFTNIDTFKRHDAKSRAIEDSNEPFFQREVSTEQKYLSNQFPRPGLQAMERECPRQLRPELRAITPYFT